MSAAVAMQMAVTSERRQSCWLGTPEIYFRKRIDNSRLVKVEDPRRAREMRLFGIALCFLFLLVMGYALQHFRAIEYGYKIEALRAAARRPRRNEPGACGWKKLPCAIPSASMRWLANSACKRPTRAR